jgi:hypothetical protein
MRLGCRCPEKPDGLSDGSCPAPAIYPLAASVPHAAGDVCICFLRAMCRQLAIIDLRTVSETEEELLILLSFSHRTVKSTSSAVAWPASIQLVVHRPAWSLHVFYAILHPGETLEQRREDKLSSTFPSRKTPWRRQLCPCQRVPPAWLR